MGVPHLNNHLSFYIGEGFNFQPVVPPPSLRFPSPSDRGQAGRWRRKQPDHGSFLVTLMARYAKQNKRCAGQGQTGGAGREGRLRCRVHESSTCPYAQHSRRVYISCRGKLTGKATPSRRGIQNLPELKVVRALFTQRQRTGL